MSNKKTLFPLLLLFFFCYHNPVFPQEVEKEVVTISYFQFPPHVYVDEEQTGTLKGALYEFLENYIGPEMGIEFSWSKEPTNLGRQLLLLEAGNIDVVSSMRKTPEREAIGAFTATPYHLVNPVLAVRSENSLTQINSVEDIIHLNIGYAGANFIPEYLRDDRVQFTFVNSSAPVEQNLRQLLAGRIDAMYVPAKSSLLVEMQRLNINVGIRIVDSLELSGESYVVFSKSQQALVERYNRAFVKVGGQAHYLKLLNKYINLKVL